VHETEVQELEVTWVRALTIWWSLIWRGLLLGFLAGFVVGFIVGFVGALLGANPSALQALFPLVGVVSGVPVGIWVVRQVLRKKFNGFRIALIAMDRSGGREPAAGSAE